MPGNDRPRQLPLEFAHPAGSAREDLVVTAANAAAVGLVDGWPDWPSPLVVVAGPPGSGKSHLAAIWQRRSGASRLDPASIGVVADGGRAFLVDDADAGGLDETGLFHLVNSVRAAGGTLLLTARRFPAAWPVTLPDLASRLRAATVVEIREPDDELLERVIAKLFADRQVEVEPHVIQYVARRIERSLATAIDVVDRLDRAAMEGKGRISRGLAATVIGELDWGQGALDL